MAERPTLPWPVWMIALDIVGTLLLAIGLFGLSGGSGLDAYRGVAIASIAVGVLLMLPFLVTTVRMVLSRANSG